MTNFTCRADYDRALECELNAELNQAKDDGRAPDLLSLQRQFERRHSWNDPQLGVMMKGYHDPDDVDDDDDAISV